MSGPVTCPMTTFALMQNTEAEPVVHVAVALILNSSGQVLLSKRPPSAHQGNLWEFPGGKVNIDEPAYDALVREIQEELGLVIKRATPIMRIPHAYPDKSVLLDVWRVDNFTGAPVGLEGQPVIWCSTGELDKLSFPAANNKITAMINLPEIYGITPTVSDKAKEFFQKLDAGIKKGLRLVQVRQPKMNKNQLESFTKQVLTACEPFGARVLVNSDPDHALQIGAHGVHLSSSQLKLLPEKPLHGDLMVSASCHNEQELKKAELIGTDFVVLSPVKFTNSHPDTIPMGWEEFSRLATACNLPVYALGGMTKDDIPEAKLAGAVGVSILSGLWD